MADVPLQWSVLDTYTAALASAALKNLANGAAALSAEINNEGGHTFGDFDLYIRGASAFAAGSIVSVWLLRAIDGTNYEDGSTTGPVTPARPADLIFPLRAVSTQQRVPVTARLMPNGKFKVLLVNTSGQALTNTDNENVLSYRMYDEVIAQ